jgi:multidrug efflux pump subunit AcrA (membrane-fusion protein)
VTDLRDDLAALRIEREPDRPQGRRWIGWGIALLILAALAAGGWQWATMERPIEVQAVAVTERAAGTQAAVLNASGYVTARRRATVSSKVTGKLVEVNVEEGVAVTEGQVLARLDNAAPRAALALAKAQVESARKSVTENDVHLAQAHRTLDRAKGLLAKGVGTQADVDSAAADVDGTEARIAALREQVTVAQREAEVQQT